MEQVQALYQTQHLEIQLVSVKPVCKKRLIVVPVRNILTKENVCVIGVNHLLVIKLTARWGGFYLKTHETIHLPLYTKNFL